MIAVSYMVSIIYNFCIINEGEPVAFLHKSWSQEFSSETVKNVHVTSALHQEVVYLIEKSITYCLACLSLLWSATEMGYACSWDQIRRGIQSTRLWEGEIRNMEEKPHKVWKWNIVGTIRTYKIFTATIRMSPPSQGNDSLSLLLLNCTSAHFQPTHRCSSWNNNMSFLTFHVRVRFSLLQKYLSQTITLHWRKPHRVYFCSDH